MTTSLAASKTGQIICYNSGQFICYQHYQQFSREKLTDNYNDSYNVTTRNQGNTMTTTTDTFVRARIDSETKVKASAALQAMGLSVSDALRILLRRVANDQAFPLELKVPNAETRAAMEELESGQGHRAASLDELMAQLHADD